MNVLGTTELVESLANESEIPAKNSWSV